MGLKSKLSGRGEGGCSLVSRLGRLWSGKQPGAHAQDCNRNISTQHTYRKLHQVI